MADALRHDYATIPGYTPDPRGLSRLASTATVFRKCVTTMPMTRGSFPGFFSGQLTGTLDDSLRRSSWIAQMHAAGYRTSFIASSYAFGKGPSSVDVGSMFDDVSLEQTSERVARPMPEAVALFDELLARRKSDHILVVLHLFGPHAPYWRASYGDNVTEVDHQIGRVLDILERRGLFDRAHVIVTSDHGESLQEHDAPPEHGWNVYGEETRIPLLWKAPAQHKQRVVDDLVRNFDIGPTVGALLSLSNDAPHSARSGRAMSAMTGEFHEPLVAFHAALPNRMYPVPQIALRTERYLMVRFSEGAPSTELYDYVNDPSELYNIASSELGKSVTRELEPRLTELRRLWNDLEVRKSETLSPEAQKNLQSLGYLGTGPSVLHSHTPVQTEPLPGLKVRFRECFSQPWAQYAGERYDGLFPVKLFATGKDLFVISNSTRDLSRLYPEAGPTRPAGPHAGATSDVWFERQQYQLTVRDGALLALLGGRRLKRYYVNIDDYKLDLDGQTFGQTDGALDRSYDDLSDASTLGILLFTKDSVVLRRDDGRVEPLGRYSSDGYRAAVDAATGAIYIADGQWIVRLHRGKRAEVFKDVGTMIFSIALRGRELWVGTYPYPSSLTNNNKPILIYDTTNGKEIGSFGSRLLRDPAKNFWGAVDVGPFGIVFPRQIVFNGTTLYVLDSGLERILSFDVF